jgi:hypothetical protein
MANAINRLLLPHFNCMTHVTDTYAKYARKRKPHLASVQRSVVGFTWTWPKPARHTRPYQLVRWLKADRTLVRYRAGPRLDLDDRRMGIRFRRQ